MPGDFQDRHVVITGARGTLGSAVVDLLVEQGAVCHLPLRRELEPTSQERWPEDRVRACAPVDLVDAASAFLCCRAAVERFRAGQGQGRIVNVTARAKGIWVNAVAPSILDTPANRAAMPAAEHDRWPGVDAAAESIVFLASPRNRVSRGGVLPVYGRS